MSSMIVCDVCGKTLDRPYYKLRVLKAEEDVAANKMKTVGNVDMHEECLAIFKTWLRDNRIKENSK